MGVVFYLRDRPRLRKAPKGFLEVVDVQPHQVDKTIRRWRRMGYDLHDQKETQAPGVAVERVVGPADVPVVVLTFVKR
jgi:hypothetical protein